MFEIVTRTGEVLPDKFSRRWEANQFIREHPALIDAGVWEIMGSFDESDSAVSGDNY